jgi:serralysin
MAGFPESAHQDWKEDDLLERPADGGVAQTAPLDSEATYEVTRPGPFWVDQLIEGTKWGGPAGQGYILEYSFAHAGSVWAPGYGAYNEPLFGFQEFNAAQKEAARAALKAWADITNIVFVEVADTATNVGDIRFGITSKSNTAHAYFPNGTPWAGDVWLGTADHAGQTDYRAGTFLYATMMHEIGHALGLRHPHEGTPITTLDWLGTSVMSYRSYSGGPVVGGYTNDFYPKTPMMDDIQAIQYLYGVDVGTHNGNDSYNFIQGSRYFQTIYDAGGSDTINCAGMTSAVSINLMPGQWSEIGPAYTWFGGGTGSFPGTVAIARNVTIEHAIGGSGSDVIWANDVGNVVEGGRGNDTVIASNGDDDVYGGDGNDYLTTGAFSNAFSDKDFVQAGNGNDSVYLGIDNDLAHGGAGNDYVDGEQGEDAVYGMAGADWLNGGNDNDFLDGGTGADSAYGGSGNDALVGFSGNDLLYGGNDADALMGGTGHDRMDGGNGPDRFVFDDGDTVAGAQRDRILGFSVPANPMIPGDYIDLTLVDAIANVAGDQAFAWRGTGAFNAAGQIRWYASGADRIVAGSTDGDAQAEFEINLAGLGKAVSQLWFLL